VLFRSRGKIVKENILEIEPSSSLRTRLGIGKKIIEANRFYKDEIKL
jgi:hypothetical protein